MSYYNELLKFLSQSKTDDLGTSRNNYKKEYLDLEVKISFGQGGSSKIPWISFLRDGQTTRKGIYPVYLFYKAEKLLILAYGISVTNPPSVMWTLKTAKTIREYFAENNLGKPFNYGDSFIFKTYNIDKLPTANVIDRDLIEILNYYKSLKFSTNVISEETKTMEFNYKVFHQKTKEAGLKFSEKIVCRFIASLCTKPFVICSGLSGSGKTKLAQSFVKWVCKSEEQYKIVPVGADWTNREPLLGFPNGLHDIKYVFPDSGVLQLIINAKKSNSKPFFLVLDEMNLSHVERYFADFLSIMESQDKIKLYSGEKREDLEQEISWPENLFIIGTVNIDETTYMFSPKVLDRANVIEFRIDESEMREYLDSPVNLDMERFINHINKQGFGSSMATDFLDKARGKYENNALIQETLMLFFNELRKSGAEFGYRSASEINRLISILVSLTTGDKKWEGKEIASDDFIDIAIMQKLLPKLHGSRNKLTKILPVLGGLCVLEKEKIKEKYFDNSDLVNYLEDNNIKYKISFEKICRMYKNAIENGYASYAEA